MKLKKQVVNLKLSRKLKKLGYPQEGLFWWLDEPERHVNFEPSLEIIEMTNGVICVAPTVAELGEMLPKNIKYEDEIWYFRSAITRVWYEGGEFQNNEGSTLCIGKTNDDVMIDGETEANARAKMLIYLIENDLYEI